VAVDVVERERLLNKAAREYLAGDITSDEYRAIRCVYGPDYIAAAQALATMNMARRSSTVLRAAPSKRLGPGRFRAFISSMLTRRFCGHVNTD